MVTKKENDPGPNDRSVRGTRQKPKVQIAPFLVILFFVVLFSLGVALGEPARVLEQAVSICLSCIGIG